MNVTTVDQLPGGIHAVLVMGPDGSLPVAIISASSSAADVERTLTALKTRSTPAPDDRSSEGLYCE